MVGERHLGSAEDLQVPGRKRQGNGYGRCMGHKKHAAVLARFPEAGRSTDDLDPEHRELIFPFGVTGCVLIYEVGYDSILILAVKHQKEVGY